MKITVIHQPTKTEPYVILNKPAGLPAAPLNEGDDCALNQAIEIFSQIKTVKGKKEIEFGLVHRIDTMTQGLVLIAVEQEFYDYIQNEQKENRFSKEYTAVVDNIDVCQKLPGFPEFSANGEMISSFFRPFGPKGSEVRPVVEGDGKAALKKGGSKVYETQIKIQGNVAVCRINQGYRHQVRCHLAWSGHPVEGDNIYNPDSRGLNHDMKFCATGIEFFDKGTGILKSYKIEPDFL